ncbi:MAG: leucyl aminopeptidase family protein [Hyphomicrobiaceae bacterium]|nr:leucyl aminopeptidase family protein [Hyphomicrobiaceae bacterium]
MSLDDTGKTPPASPGLPSIAAHFAEAEEAAGAIPVSFVRENGEADAAAGFDAHGQRWLAAQRFKPAAKRVAQIPAMDGGVAGVVLGLGNGMAGEPSGPSALLAGLLPGALPAATYRLADGSEEPAVATLATLAWGLGAYRFQRYRSTPPAEPRPRLAWPVSVDRARLTAIIEGVTFGRDLINTPAGDLGPDGIEAATRTLGERHGAKVTSIVGDDLLARNFPMIHAVGRAAAIAPRLVELRWQPPSASSSTRTVTLVGKGISFDTGGLDIKPSSNMLLMKKDMGGAASVLALGHMIMATGLDIRLRILIPAAENAIAGNAFRPSDILKSRAGTTVEVGNTDAEGRLVLADALTYGGEESPDLMVSLATLTGAARVALGPDLPALFCDDEALASRLVATGQAIGDPVWRLPFWSGYDKGLDSEVADMGNVADGGFAGAIIAALFLRRFARGAQTYAHIDMFGWRPAARPLGPKGGETHAARLLFEVLSQADVP